MPQSVNSLNIKIGGETISAEDVGDLLKSFQHLTYHIAESLESVKPKKAGAFSASIKRKYSLFFKEVKTGSLTIELITPSEGESVVGQVGNVMSLANEGRIGELKDSFSPLRARRIAQSLCHIYDSVADKPVSFDFPGRTEFDIVHERKDDLEDFLSEQLEPEEKTLFGRIIELRVDDKRTAMIDTPQGRITIKYPKVGENECIRILRNNLKKFIRITGEIQLTGTQERLNINEESLPSIESADTDVINEYVSDGRTISLREPIPFTIGFDSESEEYFISNDALGVFVANKKLPMAYQAAKEELGILRKEYVLVNEDTLTNDAKVLRKKLFERFGE